FGSMMVTNVGSLGLEEAYVPLVPYSKVPLLIAMGATARELRPGEGDKIRVVNTIRLCATFDHRILDGAHAAKMAKIVRWSFRCPEEAFGPIPAQAQITADEPAKESAK